MKVVRTYMTAAVLLICAPPAVLAQTAEPSPGWRPFFVVGAQYDARSRMTAEGGVLIPLKLELNADADELRECVCLTVTAGAGPGGRRLAIGPSGLVVGPRPLLLGSLEALATVLHTSRDPRGAHADTTYLGGEVGITLFFLVRVGFGFAHAVSGPEPHRTIPTWNVGFRTAW
jgi:hypothetical protein